MTKLKIIQDPEVKEMADVLNNIFEFDDWDLVFDDLPECGFVNDLTFQEMLNKVRPTIKKYAKTPMRCRYIEKRMKLFWNAYIDEVFPRKFKYDLRWAYAHQIVGAAEELEDYPSINPGSELHFTCVTYGLLGENCEKIYSYLEKYP